MVKLVCPTCHKTFLQTESAAMPFCSERCREIDLARWLNEQFAVPVERDEEVEESSWSERDE